MFFNRIIFRSSRDSEPNNINSDSYQPSVQLDEDFGNSDTEELTDRQNKPSISTESSPLSPPSESRLYNLCVNRYIVVKSFWMERFYNYCTPSSSELPEFSSSDILMVEGKCFKMNGPSDDSELKQLPQFLKYFQDLFWFSYRKDFTPISPSTYTSDVGWGCMLRSGQMMLSHVLALHTLDTDKLKRDSTEDQEEEYQNKRHEQYLQILRWFEDSPSAPYSVHSIAKLGVKYGKGIGEWFGPSTVAQALGELLLANGPSDLSVYVSNDSMLYLDEITSLCSTSNSWKSLFVLIPVRLGLDSMNEGYLTSLKRLYEQKSFVGILGGKPRAAMYFVAIQDDSIFYLDPHIVQPTISTSGNFSTQTFHCAIPQKMLLTTLDPSLSLGFYFADKKSFDDFWEAAEQLCQLDFFPFGIEAEAPDYRQQKKGDLSLEEFEDDIVIL